MARSFPNGASEADLLAIYRPRPGLPFTQMTFGDGTKRLVWTTFTANQVDIDVMSPKGAAYLEAILERFASAGIACDPARCRRLRHQDSRAPAAS